MSVQTDPVPPAPQHTPPREQDERLPSGRDKAVTLFSQPWIRWFISVRDKINVLNESIVSLSNITGVGFLAKDGVAWVLRTITGTADRVAVTEGDGAGGNPTIDVVTSDLIAGTNVSFTGSGVDRIIGTAPLTINATGGGSSGAGEILVADGISAPPVMLTNEAEDDFLYSDS